MGNDEPVMIDFELLTGTARRPERGTPGAAGFDLFADIYAKSSGGNVPLLIATGVAAAIPEGHVGLIWPRSSWALKHYITTDAGVIDSDYRGEICVALKSPKAFTVDPGDKIAQMVVVPFVGASMLATGLSDTERGEGGFGSTG